MMLNYISNLCDSNTEAFHEKGKKKGKLYIISEQFRSIPKKILFQG